MGIPADSQLTSPLVAFMELEVDERSVMQTYLILRRAAWPTSVELDAAAQRSGDAEDQMPDDVRWIRSYVLAESHGDVGTICIYEARSPEAIREHAERARMPADEIIAVVDTLVIRPDPEAVATG